MRFKIGNLVGFKEPEGVVIKIRKDKKTLKEYEKLGLEGDAIDICFFAGKFKGCIVISQDGGLYKKFAKQDNGVIKKKC